MTVQDAWYLVACYYFEYGSGEQASHVKKVLYVLMGCGRSLIISTAHIGKLLSVVSVVMRVGDNGQLH